MLFSQLSIVDIVPPRASQVVVVERRMKFVDFGGQSFVMIHIWRHYRMDVALCRLAPPLALISDTLVYHPFVNISYGPSLVTTFGLQKLLGDRT